MLLSVVIPTYNEEKVISNTLMEIQKHFERKRIPYEIIVVDDGSGDSTVRIVEALIKENMKVTERNKKCKRCGNCCRLDLFNLKMRCPFITKNNLCYLYRFRFKKYLMFLCWLGPFIRRKDCAVKPRKETDTWLHICWDIFVFFIPVVLSIFILFLIYYIFRLLLVKFLG